MLTPDDTNTLAMASHRYAVLPGTCGELFQGTLDGRPCLVSLPIDRWVRSRVTWRPNSMEWSVPKGRHRTLQAMKLAADRWGQAGAAELDWASQLPEGKGFGSSTADICASLYAMGDAIGRILSCWEVVQMATAIEPTDSSPLPDLALLDHRRGDWWRGMGRLPQLDILVIDTGGAVDTLGFNRIDYGQLAHRFGDIHADAFSCLQQGLSSGSLRLIGHAATMSAQVQQQILPKPLFDKLVDLAEQTNAVGVNVAHSGTLVGFLYGENSADCVQISRYISGQLPAQFKVCWQRSVTGGVRWQNEGENTNYPIKIKQDKLVLS